MTEKRFTTVELPKPNKWGIWYDGAYLSTYQVCILLNEYVDIRNENKQLKSILEEMKDKNEEIWLMDGRIIRLKKVLKGDLK